MNTFQCSRATYDDNRHYWLQSRVNARVTHGGSIYSLLDRLSVVCSINIEFTSLKLRTYYVLNVNRAFHTLHASLLQDMTASLTPCREYSLIKIDPTGRYAEGRLPTL